MDIKVTLKRIPVDSIKPNPENPRIVFRQEEMDSLLVSIKKYGVQVPITVYEDGNHYVLIDGERRWRTCVRLNLPSVPAIIRDKPTELENLLMMFNIHSLREQWDVFTISNKLTRIIDLLKKKYGRVPNEPELSEETGLSRGTIRRCRLLMSLPDRFKAIILEELKKPKGKQELTEDFFLEMEQNLRTVKNNLPEAIDDIDEVRDVLISKFQRDIIDNMVDFRKLGKIATAPSNVDFKKSAAVSALRKVFSKNDVSIEEVYNSTVGSLYGEKRLISTFSNTLYYIKNLKEDEISDTEIIELLKNIKRAIERILKEVG